MRVKGKGIRRRKKRWRKYAGQRKGNKEVEEEVEKVRGQRKGKEKEEEMKKM
jgi:hypothetical protein